MVLMEYHPEDNDDAKDHKKSDYPEVIGDGVNRLRPDWLARQLQVMGRDERLGIAAVAEPRTIACPKRLAWYSRLLQDA